MNARDLPYRNFKAVESVKRVARKNKIIRDNKTKNILKNTQANILKAMTNNKHQKVIIEQLEKLDTIDGNRAKLRELSRVLNQYTEEEKKVDKFKSNLNFNQVLELKVKKVIISNIEIMRRIHKCLTKNDAVSSNIVVTKRIFPLSIKKILDKDKLTYCPEEITLNEEEINTLIKNNVKHDRRASVKN